MSDPNENKAEDMKRVVIEALTEELKKPSAQDHEELAVFSKGLESGKELDLTILTGGLCNFSYKLRFKDSDDTAVLFVKLTFGTPVLFPDVPASPTRTHYEFKMMELFAKITPYPDSSVKPFLCFDVEGGEENMKVLVTQFSSRLEEQAGNIFVDGTIDKAYASKIAEQLVALHSAEVTEPDFNADMKEFFMTMTGLGEIIFAGYLDESNENPDRTALRAREMGKDCLDEFTDIHRTQLMRTDCYVHGDCHAFNMLVEGNLKALANDDPSAVGDVAIIDWEFCHVGPQGKDLGWVQCFPIACMFAHAIAGEETSSKSILEFCESFWESYAAAVSLEGKELTIEDVYRQMIGFLGIMLNAYSGMGFHMDFLPIEEGTEDLIKVKDSLGVLALECFDMGWRGENSTLDELKQRFKDAIQKELDLLSPAEPKTVSKRRSSLLRTTGRRVSDAHSYFSMASNPESTARCSFASTEFKAEATEAMRQVSFADDEEEDEVLAELNVVPSSRRKRISVMPRVSLALSDLKRKSVQEWDRIIVDFSF